MKFIADAMLGRLAKWLRILGFDVLYFPDIEDVKLIRIARDQERTVLTRDTRLIQRKGLKDPVLIRSNNASGQLFEIKDLLDLTGAAPSGRCSICNEGLYEIADRREVKEAVPDYVYYNFDYFIKCRGCGKVYWEGSHQKDFRQRMKEILSKSGDMLKGAGDSED